MLRDTFLQRFAELEVEFAKMPFSKKEGYRNTHVTNGFWRKWATSAQSLINAAFGSTAPHVRNFNSLYDTCQGEDYEVRALHAVFQSAKADFEGGYVFNVDLRVSGEVFGDFIALARQALSEGHKDVAAVLACAALEDVLKKYASITQIDVTDKTMTEIINALKSAGLVAGAQKTLLDAMPRIRNAALHADWTKLTEPDVGSVIAFVEQFLITKFSD
jgi:hypothetical protein